MSTASLDDFRWILHPHHPLRHRNHPLRHPRSPPSSTTKRPPQSHAKTKHQPQPPLPSTSLKTSPTHPALTPIHAHAKILSCQTLPAVLQAAEYLYHTNSLYVLDWLQSAASQSRPPPMRGYTYPLSEYEILEMVDVVVGAGVKVPEDVMGAWGGAVGLGVWLVGDAKRRAESLGEGMMDAKGSLENWEPEMTESLEALEGFVRTLKKAIEWIVAEKMRRSEQAEGNGYGEE